MKFSTVSECFSQIEQVSGRLEITRLLAHLLKQANAQEAAIICNLSLGQLHAPYIGTKFNFAEKNIAKVLEQLLDISELELVTRMKKMGDLSLVIEDGAWRAQDDLTVNQVYKALCDMEETTGTGSQEEKQAALTALLQKLDTASARVVVKVLVGKLRLGFSDMTLVDALSWMITGDKSLRTAIENAYNVRADMGLIAYELKENGIKKIESMQPQVGIPIIPSAAERLPTAKAIIEKLGPCVAQPKLDGFRLQIHVDNSGKQQKINFYSRNLQDMSQMFPDLHQAFAKFTGDSLICEGEAIVYDPNTGAFSKFQETVKRKRKHGIEQAIKEFPLQVFIFDIMYLNGKDLMALGHEERRAYVEKVFAKATTDLVHPIEEKKVTTAGQLEDYFNQNIAAGLEGLVVKRPDAIYQPGKRNFNWIKLKRTQEGHIEDTLDCVILGYYVGEGRRTQFGVGAFLVGVFNKQEDRFETIAKVGTGLSDADWVELKLKCDAIKVKEQPHNVVCAKELYPDVWVNPEIVCSVFADEITVSPLHAAGKTDTHLGYALRFPRFLGYRTDKSATEATTSYEIKRLYEDQFKK